MFQQKKTSIHHWYLTSSTSIMSIEQQIEVMLQTNKAK